MPRRKWPWAVAASCLSADADMEVRRDLVAGALGSVKASPGATTTALALGAVWPRTPHVVVCECDPAGGDVAANFRLAETPGLLSLAAASRREHDDDLLWRHTQALPGGLRVVAAPVGADQARAAIAMLGGGSFGPLVGAARRPDAVVIADCGRLDAGSPALGVAGGAAVLCLVARARFAEIAHLADAVAALRRVLGSSSVTVGLVLTGPGDYPPTEVADVLAVPVLGVLPADKHSAAALAGQLSIRRGLSRLPLMRAARTLADRLESIVDGRGPRGSAPAQAAAAPGPTAGGAW